MKGRVVLIELQDGQSRAALVVDGVLEDLLIDPQPKDTVPRPGAVYWATVDRIAPKLGGAFVKLGHREVGYLRFSKELQFKSDILVQVTGCAEPGKAAPITQRVLYKSRFVIVTPDTPGINVSRQIRCDEERARLTNIALDFLCNNLEKRENNRPIGLIVRTEAQGLNAGPLCQDIAWALGRLETAEDHARRSASGNLAIQSSAAEQALSEWDLHDTIVEISSKTDVWNDFMMYLEHVLKAIAGRSRHADEADLFDHYGVWDDVERLCKPRVNLPSGGWMAIEPTSAMILIDINTGGDFSFANGVKANLEAAKELPRQLRLRGLGGQITVDMAPMKKGDRKRVEEALKAALRRDPIETTIAGWTPLGHLELQRKRERRPLSELF
ncbi:MAG: ribonuclease E/G [Pseudomonadota bacterium]